MRFLRRNWVLFLVIVILASALPGAILVSQAQEGGRALSEAEGVSTSRPGAEYTGHFPGGCPPNAAATPGEQQSHITQKNLSGLIERLHRVEGPDGVVIKYEADAFCFFLDDGLVKGVLFHGYNALGRRLDPKIELWRWFVQQGLDPAMMCNIDWIWDLNPCEPEPKDGKALVDNFFELRQAPLAFLCYFIVDK